MSPRFDVLGIRPVLRVLMIFLALACLLACLLLLVLPCYATDYRIFIQHTDYRLSLTDPVPDPPKSPYETARQDSAEHHRPFLVFLTQESCQPCKTLLAGHLPSFQKIGAVAILDIHQQADLSQRIVRCFNRPPPPTPTLCVWEPDANGRPTHFLQGTQEILTFIQSHTEADDATGSPTRRRR